MKKDEKKTIYFHIGTNKTGTSALQAFLAENSNILKEKGIYYPQQPEYWNKEFKIGSGNAQYLFSDCDKYPLEAKGIDKIRNIFSLTEKYYQILLSSEWLWLIDDKTSFFNNLKKEGIKIVVIVYLRRQDEYLESAINQRIKVSKYKTSTYPECLNPNEILNSPLEELDYYKELEKIKLSIGRTNIIVRPYEKSQFKNNNIFSDFLNIFNLELTDEFVLPPKIVNPRLSRDFMEMKRICNSLPIENKTLFNVFCNSLIKLSANENDDINEMEYSLFSYEEKLDIINKYDKSNQKIAKEYLNRMDGKLFIDQLSNSNISKTYNGPSRENVIKAFGYLCCKQFEEIDALKNHNNIQDLKISECMKKFDEISSEIDVLKKENKKLLEHQSILEGKIDNKVLEYYKLLNSKSWKITKPLRLIKSFLRK